MTMGSEGPEGEAGSTVACECCGMTEECTHSYVTNIRKFYCGRWICGLCSEDVKEHLKGDQDGKSSVEVVLESHMSLCKSFNRTTRINPKLGFASAMREIARRSSQNRRFMGEMVSLCKEPAESLHYSRNLN